VDDGVTTGALDLTVAVGADAGGLDVVGGLDEQAATTAVRAQAAPKAGINRSADSDLEGSDLKMCIMISS
jgi:hypothetical protein